MPAKKIPVEMEENFMEHVRDDAKRAMALARARFREAEDAVESSIKKDPVHAAMVAAGIGAALGAAISIAVMKKRRND